MQVYSEMELFKDFELLIGKEGGEIIFSHHFRTNEEREALIGLEKRYFPQLKKGGKEMENLFEELIDFKKGKDIDPSQFKVKFSRGTEFEKKVWKTLKRTKKGDLITYKKLGELAGYKDAQRAVGNTMRKNYLIIFVPCHRVIGKGKKIGGFSAGIENKKNLLRIENNEL